jgi:hypothetical protein
MIGLDENILVEWVTWEIPYKPFDLIVEDDPIPCAGMMIKVDFLKLLVGNIERDLVRVTR